MDMWTTEKASVAHISTAPTTTTTTTTTTTVVVIDINFHERRGRFGNIII